MMSLDLVWMIGLGFLGFMLIMGGVMMFKPEILDKLLT